MVFRTSRSTTRAPWPPKPRRPDYRLDRREGYENQVLLPFDDRFMSGYGDFLDKVDSIACQYEVSDDARHGMFQLTQLAVHVEIMIEEKNGETALADNFMEDVYSTLGDVVGGAFMDAVLEFHNDKPPPRDLDTLRMVHAQSEGFVLMGVTPVREEDTIIYTFVNLGFSQ